MTTTGKLPWPGTTRAGLPKVCAPQGGGIGGGALLAAQGGENGKGVEAVGEAGEVDLIPDWDTGQDPVPGGRLGAVGVDVDDDQAGGAPGDADTELGVLVPPLLDEGLVEGGGVEAVAPTASAEAGAIGRHMGVLAAPTAVLGWRLAARASGCTGQPRRAHRCAVARVAATEDTSAEARVESLWENCSSEGICTPYQRPKRPNDEHSLANGAGVVVQHMQNIGIGVSTM